MVLIFCGMAVGIALLAPRPASAVTRRLLSLLRRWPAPAISMALIFGLGLCICCATSLLLFHPVPSVHDEFAYVLTAETFAQGRLTNPSHPHSAHFDSWHIIQEPSYQGKYPPAQALVLAAGQWLAGQMLLGVWLSYAAALAASYWACLAWLPRRWALLAVLLIMLNVPLAFAWGNSYWGGAVAMLGGCLLVGAWGRLRSKPHWLTGTAFGIGLGLLAASRPFEGILTAIPIGIAALLDSTKVWFAGSQRRQLASFWLAASATMLAGGLALMTYNHAVTGHAFKMPYQVWTAQQGQALDRLLTPAMVLVKANYSPSDQVDSVTNSPTIGRSAEWRSGELARWMQVRNDARLAFTWDKLLKTYAFYLQATLCLPLLAIPWLIQLVHGLKAMLSAVVLVTIGCCMHLSAGHAHYVASLTIILTVLSVLGLRYFTIALPSLGKPLLGGIVVAWLLTAGFSIAAEIVQQPHRNAHTWAERRLAMEAELQASAQLSGCKQIVFVNYADDHNVHREWVYNRADIDSAEVLWANDLGLNANNQLLKYYQGLGCEVDAWWLNVDRVNAELRRYHEDKVEREE